MYKQNGDSAIESITAERRNMSLTINNNTQIQGVHQGTPTENENFLKLQNVLALVQDNL